MANKSHLQGYRHCTSASTGAGSHVLGSRYCMDAYLLSGFVCVRWFTVSLARDVRNVPWTGFESSKRYKSLYWIVGGLFQWRCVAAFSLGIRTSGGFSYGYSKFSCKRKSDAILKSYCGSLWFFSFQLVFNLAVLWILVFCVLSEGLRSFGKVVVALIVIPMIGLGVLCTKMLTMINASSLQVT